MLTNRQLQDVISKMSSSELDQAVTMKDLNGDIYVAINVAQKEVKMFYRRNEMAGKCYTALQMKQMFIPENEWEFDHAKTITTIEISKF